MNRTPDEFVRVPYADMTAFVTAACQEVGLSDDRASLLAELLATNDLRGVFSHGTRMIATYWDQGYLRMVRDGLLNPEPDVTVVRETPVSVHLDGDGGLGYFPAYEATERAIEKADEVGMAAMATRNHGHIGAAGVYVRQALDHDLIAFVTSGSQRRHEPGDSLHEAVGGGPMAFGAPTDVADPLVLDFGPVQDLYPHSPHGTEIAEKVPGLVLRHFGMGAICQAWGGLLPGLAIDGLRDYQAYTGATQGALALFVRIDCFSDPDRFKQEVDAYVRSVADLEPLTGFDEAMLPGGPEAQRERENRERGIPVGPEHRAELERLADDLGIEVPWG